MQKNIKDLFRNTLFKILFLSSLLFLSVPISIIIALIFILIINSLYTDDILENYAYLEILEESNLSKKSNKYKKYKKSNKSKKSIK
jgi:hypothetical protein